MKKRASSQQKQSHPYHQTVGINLGKEENPQYLIPKHHCPPKHPKHQHKKQNNSELELKILTSPKIKQYPNPLMKELRRLVINQIDSGDRLLNYLSLNQHKNALKLYAQDRKKLIKYLNRLIIRSLKSDSVKIELNTSQRKPNEVHSPVANTENEIESRTHENQTTRKRCNSECEFTNIKISNQIDRVKKRLGKLEKQRKTSAFPFKMPFKKIKRQQKEHTTITHESVVLQDLILQAKIILETPFQENSEKESKVQMQKADFDKLIEINSHIKEEFHKIYAKHKEEIIRQEKHIKELLKQVQANKLQKQKLEEQKQQFLQTFQQDHEHQYTQLKDKVSRLYNQLEELIDEIDKKDEQIDSMKIENTVLRSDLEGMQDINRIGKSQQRTLAEYVEELQQKIRIYDEALTNTEFQFNEYKEQKQKETYEQKMKIQHLQKTVHVVGDNSEMQITKSSLDTLKQEHSMFKFEKSRLDEVIKRIEAQNTQLNKEVLTLENKLRQAKEEESIARMNNSFLKKHFEQLQVENSKLQKELLLKQSMFYDNKHITIDDSPRLPESSKKLSMEVARNETMNNDIFDQEEFASNRVEKHTTHSEVGQVVKPIKPIQHYPESEVDFQMKKKQQPPHHTISQSDFEVSHQTVYNADVSGFQDIRRQKESNQAKKSNPSQKSSNSNISNRQVQSKEESIIRLQEIEELSENQHEKQHVNKDLSKQNLSDSMERMDKKRSRTVIHQNSYDQKGMKREEKSSPSKSNLSSQAANRDLYIRFQHVDPFTPSTPPARNKNSKDPQL